MAYLGKTVAVLPEAGVVAENDEAEFVGDVLASISGPVQPSIWNIGGEVLCGSQRIVWDGRGLAVGSTRVGRDALD
jgi:hypothetical protein